MKQKTIIGLAVVYMLIQGVCMAAIIADHTRTSMEAIDQSLVTTACGVFRLYYGHTSHGSQIITGMETMRARYGAPWNFNETGSDGALSVHEESGDLGGTGDTGWADTTRSTLDSASNDRNVVMWSWCGGVSDNTSEGISTYLSTMNQLEQEYPDVMFIYMTGHLDGTGESGNLHQRNEQIRSYCLANDKTLFDFADIESYDPSGGFFLDRGANDECNYDAGNWAVEWCEAHPVSDLCLDCECAHSEPLNCNLKARAFWWLLAELASENPGLPTPTPAPPETGVELEMPGHLFRSGDHCYLSATVTHNGETALNGCPLFVILVAYDALFWGPSFSDYDNYLGLYPTFAPGDTWIEVIPEFDWPAIETSAEGLYFIAAVTNPTVDRILGVPDIWEFGWLNN